MTRFNDVFELTIGTANAAFDGDEVAFAVAHLLREVAHRFEHGQFNGIIYDINGNKVGGFEWSGRSEQ